MKFLLSNKDFKATKKADLIQSYKELYDRYFCQQTELQEAKAELKKLRQAARKTTKPTTKVYEHDASKAYERINHNYKLIGQPMTATQLKTILSFMAERDYGFGTAELLGKSTLWANALINKMIQTKATHPKRPKPYNPEELYNRFIRKYPEWYTEVITK